MNSRLKMKISTELFNYVRDVTVRDKCIKGDGTILLKLPVHKNVDGLVLAIRPKKELKLYLENFKKLYKNIVPWIIRRKPDTEPEGH